MDMLSIQSHLFIIEYLYLHFTVTLFECLLNILPYTVTAFFFYHYPVDHHFDRMFFGFGKFDLIIKANHHTVYHRTDIPFMAKRLEHICKGTFFLFDQWGHNDEF